MLSPSKFIKERYIPIGIFLFAFLVRLIYIVEFKGTPLAYCLTGDSLFYSEWAGRIASGALLPANTFEMAPLYAYLLGLFYKFISTDLFFVRIIQIIVGSFSVLLVYSITRDILENRYWGLAAALVAAVYGPFIFFDAMVTKPFLAVFFVLLMLFFLLRIERPGMRYAFLAALALAFAVLVQESIIILIPIILLWILRRKETAEKVRKTLFFLLGLAVVILPVALMNYAATGEIVPITSAGGEHFYIGNSEGADGTYKSPDFVRPKPQFKHEDFRRRAEELTGRELTRKESSAFWFNEGLEYIFSNPTAYMDLFARKFLLFWNFYEHADNQNYYLYKASSNVLDAPVFTFGIIAPFGLLGLCLSIRRLKKFSLLFLVLLFYMTGELLIYNSAASRLPVVPILIIFSVFSVYWFVEKAREKKFVYIGIALYVLVVFFIVSGHDMSGGAADETNPGICSAASGESDR